MKFSINKSELQNALSIVTKGTSTRSTLPVLSGIMIEARDSELVFHSTDLDLSIQYAAPALIEEEGAAVLPGKLFQDIIKNLPDAAVHVEASDTSASIMCDKASFNIKSLSPEDFPAFPHVSTQQQIDVPFARFSSMVRKVARVVSKDESRAILTGVYVTLDGNTLTMVATDSYRLALAEAQVEGNSNNFTAVISGNFLSDIAALPKTDDPITLALSENQIVVTYQNTVFINRRIEGNFPNYKQLIPSSYVTRVAMNTSNLVSALKRTSLLGSNSSPVKMSIDLDMCEVTLSSTTQDVGTAQEVLRASGEGSSLDIAFNCSYLIDGLNSIDTESVYLEADSPVKPGIFKAAGNEGFLYLVMPVRVS